jgi:PleD family two-component response regulator
LLIEQATIPYGPERLAVGASAGIVPLRADLDAAQVLDAADKAMYARKAARKSGRGTSSASARESARLSRR